MKTYRLKSYAKINLSLGVLGKNKSKFHKIETIISFINLYDEIYIRLIKGKKHLVTFQGKYSKNINNKNTVTKLLSILDFENLLNDKKYLIKIKKNIPTKSGLGGGSMNASSILNYLAKTKKINLNKEKKSKIAKKIGSDVIFGLEKKNSILFANGKVYTSSKKLGFFTVLIKPNFGCSTKRIYSQIKKYSKPQLRSSQKFSYNISHLEKAENDLEKVAFKIYPKLSNIKKSMNNLPKVKFTRMTGSGSCLIAYFSSKKASLNAAKILKKKYQNYWCFSSKTI